MTTAWWQSRLTVLDLESTSTDPQAARIVTVAVGYVGGGMRTDVVTLVAKPSEPIPAQAAAIHGYTTERAERYGRDPGEVLDIVLGILDRRPPDSPLCVFNAPYDLTVLTCEAARYGLDGLEARRPLRVVDPLVCDKHLDRYRPGKRRLADVCRHYRAPLDQAHDAAFDAIACARVAWVIGEKGRVVRRVRNDEERTELAALSAEWEHVRGDLDLLHAAQVRWAAEQAAGLEEHFARKGTPESVSGAWPVVPVMEKAA